MPLAKLSPNLMVEDVNETVAFYVDILGFDFAMGVAEATREVVAAWPSAAVLQYAMVVSGGVGIMFQSRHSLGGELPLFKNAEIGGSLTLYIECDDIEARHARCAAADLPLLKDLRTTFYGMRELYIQDPNGYVLAFAQKAA